MERILLEDPKCINTSMKASLETLTGVIRTHPEGNFGDPYSWVCSVSFIKDVAYLHGVLHAPAPSEWRSMMELLQNEGITTVMYARHRDGEVSWKSFDISKKSSTIN